MEGFGNLLQLIYRVCRVYFEIYSNDKASSPEHFHLKQIQGDSLFPALVMSSAMPACTGHDMRKKRLFLFPRHDL